MCIRDRLSKAQVWTDLRCRQAGLVALGSCLGLPKGGCAADSALRGRGRWDETTGPKSTIVAERLPWAHPSPPVRALAGAPAMPLTAFLPSPSPLSFPAERKRMARSSSAVHAAGPWLGSAALPVGACCLPAPADLLFVRLRERSHQRAQGSPPFLGHFRGCGTACGAGRQP